MVGMLAESTLAASLLLAPQLLFPYGDKFRWSKKSKARLK